MLNVFHKSFGMGMQPKRKHFSRTLTYCDCHIKLRRKDKDYKHYTEDRTFFNRFIQCYTRGKPCTHAVFLRSLVTTDKFTVVSSTILTYA